MEAGERVPKYLSYMAKALCGSYMQHIHFKLLLCVDSWTLVTIHQPKQTTLLNLLVVEESDSHSPPPTQLMSRVAVGGHLASPAG